VMADVRPAEAAVELAGLPRRGKHWVGRQQTPSPRLLSITHYSVHSRLSHDLQTLPRPHATCLSLTATDGSHDSTPRAASHVQGTDAAEELLSLQTRPHSSHFKVGGARWTRERTNSTGTPEAAFLHTRVSWRGTCGSLLLTLGYSRLIGTTVAFACAYTTWRWLDVEIEIEEEKADDERETKRVRWRKVGEDTEDEDVEEEDQDDEDDEEETGLIFFPTGLSRPKRKEFYRGSDPEWQEFVRIAPDRTRLDRVRGELISMVRGLAMNNPTYVRRLGNINPNAGSIWIEVRFPDGPPVEYERPGYELTDELNFRKTTRPVDEIHHRRLNSVLAPTATATSLYMDVKRRADMSWREFKKYLGWKETAPTAQRILTQMPAPPSSPNSPAPTTASTTSTPPPAASSSGDSQTKDSRSTSPSPSKGITERFGASLPDPTVVPTMDLAYFRAMFRKNNKQTNISPPRGTFMVGGLIEIIGERAKMTLDVAAFYDPKTARYVMLKARVRSITDYKQSPKGGP
jgi:hypothetical protein